MSKKNTLPRDTASKPPVSEKNKNQAENSKKRLIRKLKITAIAVGSLIVLLILADLIAAAVTIHTWTHPEKTRWNYDETPASVGLDYHSFSVETENGTVRGWKIAAQTPIGDDAEEWIEATEYSDKTVILAPNYDSNRQLMKDMGGIDYYAEWCNAGFNVIVFDWTGSGISDGTKNVFTLDKTEELKAVVAFAEEETKASYIAIQSFGFSCYPAAQVAAESDSVDALILDSCYESFSQIFFGNLGNWTGLNFSPVKETIQFLFPIVTGVDAESASLTAAVKSMKNKAIFFIQGGNDEQFGTAGAESLYNLCKSDNNVDRWVPDGVLHLRARSYDRDDYFNRILNFLNDSYEENRTA